MPTYISLLKLTEQGIKNIKDAPARVEQAITAMETGGGKFIVRWCRFVRQPEGCNKQWPTC
jgi:uncharacterized protein with GYD domain